MRIKIGSSIAYKDLQASTIYGVGIVESVTDTEYTILWALRGSKRYKRSILDQKLGDIFQRVEYQTDLPREKRLQLGASKNGISFNENYDRVKVNLLCDDLKKSRSQSAKDVAVALTGEMFTKMTTLRPTIKTALRQLAELCSNKSSGVISETSRKISQELFFGYVIKTSDFKRDEHSEPIPHSAS